jgi:hypothetical protein
MGAAHRQGADLRTATVMDPKYRQGAGRPLCGGNGGGVPGEYCNQPGRPEFCTRYDKFPFGPGATSHGYGTFPALERQRVGFLA